MNIKEADYTSLRKLFRERGATENGSHLVLGEMILSLDESKHEYEGRYQLTSANLGVTATVLRKLVKTVSMLNTWFSYAEPNTKTYRFYWTTGDLDVGFGKDPADALTSMGFSKGAIAALDFHEEVTGPSGYVFDADVQPGGRWVHAN